MSLIDHSVGRVMEALKHNGLKDNTLIIFTADHGFSLGHHGFWGHGQATWPSNAFRIAYNIPLLMWAPGLIEPGQKSKAFVSSCDLYATLLGLLEFADETGMDNLPSRDFSNLLTEGSCNWIDEVYIEQEETRAIRTPKWSYVERFKGSKTYTLENELYDLKKDPDERNNVAGQPETSRNEHELSSRLNDFFSTHADPRFDLWNGGTVKSNTSRPWLWKDAWGSGWQPVT